MPCPYKLNEEIVRQRVELALTPNPFFLCFSNPTAGPWKVVRFPKGAASIVLRRYGREENRQDLALLHHVSRLMLLLEAKIEARKVVGEMVKICETFVEEEHRFAEALERVDEQPLSYLPGFVFGTQNPSKDSGLILRAARRLTNAPLVFFAVTQSADCVLHPSWGVAGATSELHGLLRQLLGKLPEFNVGQTLG